MFCTVMFGSTRFKHVHLQPIYLAFEAITSRLPHGSVTDEAGGLNKDVRAEEHSSDEKYGHEDHAEADGTPARGIRMSDSPW